MTTRSPRPSRPPVPPLPQMDALDRMHQQIMVVLGHLASLIEHIDRRGVDTTASKNALEVHRFFEGAARQHHDAEEQFVFPALLADGDSDLTQHVLRLRQDHGWLEEDWRLLGPQLQAIAEGYSWYDLEMLRHAIPIFTALYEEHIALEESIIYPEARRRHMAAAMGQEQRRTSA